MSPPPNPMSDADAFELRAATADDAADIINVILDAGSMFRDAGMTAVSDNPPRSMQEIVTEIETGQVWVASGADGGLAGCILVRVVDGNVHIEQVSTLRAYQGRGLGRRLIKAAEEWARAAGHERVTLTTFTDVAWNAPLYRRLGYHVLSPDDLGEELVAIRAEEARRGLDGWGRCAMARNLWTVPALVDTAVSCV